MSAVAQALGALPGLIPSDAVNLADDREECLNCVGQPDGVAGLKPDQEGELRQCPVCHGKGSLVRPTGRDHLSFSAISTQLNCKQRYGFAYESRLELVERQVPKALGSAYQKAVELGDPEAGVRYLYEKAPPARSQEAADRLLVEEAIVRSASALYLDLWGQPERSEFEYRVRLRNPWTGAYSRTFDLLGYADGLSDKAGWFELVENKFVGRIQQVSVKKLSLDRQLMLECYGIWRATGKAVREVRYRFMQKPSIKQRGGRKKDKSDAETVADYAARIDSDYRERPEFYAHEEHLLVGTDDLVRIEAELWQWAAELREARRAHIWPRNSSFCHEYGGCPYLPLCTQGADAEGLYRVKPERPVVAESLPE